LGSRPKTQQDHAWHGALRMQLAGTEGIRGNEKMALRPITTVHEPEALAESTTWMRGASGWPCRSHLAQPLANARNNQGAPREVVQRRDVEQVARLVRPHENLREQTLRA
jgi:hypothetical protein